MGSVTGTESDSTLKMRLAPILALVILSCLLLNLTSAQRSASRKTAKNCRGSSSRPSSSRPSSSRGSTGGRGSTRCRPNVKPTSRTTSKATSTTASNNLKPTRRTTKKLPTKKSGRKTTRTSSRPSSSTTSSETSGPSRKPRLPTKKSKQNKTKSGTSDSAVPPTDVEGNSVSSNDSNDEERDSVPSNKRIKVAAKKYLGKVKDKLQSAAIWFLENKDKTIDDILVDKWKKKCPGGISTKKKRKQCVSDALAESDDDTPEEKEIKDALKSLVEEDSEAAYDFLSKSSSRTFGDIENEEEIQDKLSEMPEKYEKLWEEDKSKTFTELESEFEREKAEKMSKLSNNMKAVFSKVGGQISTKIRSWSRSCTKKSRTTQSRKCQNEAGGSGQKKQKCREAQSARRRSCLEEVFEPTPEDSLQDRNIKAELEELAVQDPETGTQLVESCQIPGKRRVKRQLPPAAGPAAPAPACALPLYIPSNVANAKKHFLDKSYRQIIMDAARTGNAPGLQLQAVIDELGGERVDAEINTVLADNIQIDLTKFTAHGKDEKGKWKNGAYYDYEEYVSNEDFEFVQITWVPNLDGFCNNLYTPVNGQYMEEGHYKAEVMKDEITIGIDTWQSGPNFGLSEISHLKAFDKNPLPKTHDISGEAYKTLFGTNPYDYT